MSTKWRSEPLVPTSYDDVATVAKLARRARNLAVDFEWELSRDEMERLREAVHSWGSVVRGKYKGFDSQVLDAINAALGEPDAIYRLDAPKGADPADSNVEAMSTGAGFRVRGHATFDLIFGYARAGLESKYRIRLGDALCAKLEKSIEPLGWSMEQLSRRELQPVVNVLFGLALDYGIAEEAEPAPPTGSMDLEFHGPLHWHRDAGLPWLFDHPLGKETGIYVWTFPIDGQEYIHYVGQTTRTFAGRLAEHLACFLSGRYSILDSDELARGEQKLLWPGASSTEDHGAMLTEFVDQANVLVPKIEKLLRLLRFHIAPVKMDGRLLDRIEGTLGRYFQDHPDKGIRKAFGPGARFPAAIPFETRIRCRISTASPLVGLPDVLIV
ncbi:MAG: hypothetical protein MJD61_04120 [Proteobacteria bacterium]|nr:hypothetical protein [Pseudomonadota bacterium]